MQDINMKTKMAQRTTNPFRGTLKMKENWWIKTKLFFRKKNNKKYQVEELKLLNNVCWLITFNPIEEGYSCWKNQKKFSGNARRKSSTYKDRNFLWYSTEFRKS